MRIEKKYQKRCVYCGAEIYSDTKERDCYKCGDRMKIIKSFKIKNEKRN